MSFKTRIPEIITGTIILLFFLSVVFLLYIIGVCAYNSLEEDSAYQSFVQKDWPEGTMVEHIMDRKRGIVVKHGYFFIDGVNGRHPVVFVRFPVDNLGYVLVDCRPFELEKVR